MAVMAAAAAVVVVVVVHLHLHWVMVIGRGSSALVLQRQRAQQGRAGVVVHGAVRQRRSGRPTQHGETCSPSAAGMRNRRRTLPLALLPRHQCCHGRRRGRSRACRSTGRVGRFRRRGFPLRSHSGCAGAGRLGILPQRAAKLLACRGDTTGTHVNTRNKAIARAADNASGLCARCAQAGMHHYISIGTSRLRRTARTASS